MSKKRATIVFESGEDAVLWTGIYADRIDMLTCDDYQTRIDMIVNGHSFGLTFSKETDYLDVAKWLKRDFEKNARRLYGE